MTKKQFRHTKPWKIFRAQVLKDSNYTCVCCGRKRPPKTLDLHHTNDDDYQIPEFNKVTVLCSLCHRFVSALERMKVKPNTDYLQLIVRDFLTPSL